MLIYHDAFGVRPSMHEIAERIAALDGKLYIISGGKLYEKGPKPLLRSLKRAKAPSAEGAEVLRVERGYFNTNARRMDYPTFRTRGLPIASGAIESAARHLVQDRLKRPGARWSEEGAAAVLAVRCRLSSQRSLAA